MPMRPGHEGPVTFVNMAQKAYAYSFGLLIAVVFLMFTAGMIRGKNSLLDFFTLRESRLVLTETIAKLHEENHNIEEEIRKIRESKNYAKKVMKDKYHLTEDGESIIFFAD